MPSTFTLPLHGGKGVATVEDHAISNSIKRQVDLALQNAPDLPDGKTVGAVAVTTFDGGVPETNLAFVAKKETEKWGDAKVVAWVGKKWSSEPVKGGVALQWSK